MTKNILLAAMAASFSFGTLAATTETLDVNYMYGTTDGAHSVEFTGESGQVEVGSWFHGDVAADGSITLDLSTFTNCEDYTAKVLNSDGYLMTFTGTMDMCPSFETYYMPALQQLAINSQTNVGGIEGSDHVRLGFVRNTGTTYFSGDFTYNSELGFVGTIAAGFNTMLEMGTITVDVYDSAGNVTDIFTFEGRDALSPMGSGIEPHIAPLTLDTRYFTLRFLSVPQGTHKVTFVQNPSWDAEDQTIHTWTQEAVYFNGEASPTIAMSGTEAYNLLDQGVLTMYGVKATIELEDGTILQSGGMALSMDTDNMSGATEEYYYNLGTTVGAGKYILQCTGPASFPSLDSQNYMIIVKTVTEDTNTFYFKWPVGEVADNATENSCQAFNWNSGSTSLLSAGSKHLVN